jgi:hypothetical protein
MTLEHPMLDPSSISFIRHRVSSGIVERLSSEMRDDGQIAGREREMVK